MHYDSYVYTCCLPCHWPISLFLISHFEAAIAVINWNLCGNLQTNTRVFVALNGVYDSYTSDYHFQYIYVHRVPTMYWHISCSAIMQVTCKMSVIFKMYVILTLCFCNSTNQCGKARNARKYTPTAMPLKSFILLLSWINHCPILSLPRSVWHWKC